MSYRDDREADRERIAALEAELADARQRIATLEGRKHDALVLATGGALARRDGPPSAQVRWLGAPLHLEMTRRFDAAYPPERFEELLERIRAVVCDPGQTELLRTSMTWHATAGQRAAGPFTVVTVVSKHGATTLTVSDRLGQLAGALYGGVGGGVGGGGLVAPIAASIALPALAPVFVAGWLGGVFLGTRSLFKRVARRRAEQLQQLFDALVDEIETALRAS